MKRQLNETTKKHIMDKVSASGLTGMKALEYAEVLAKEEPKMTNNNMFEQLSKEIVMFCENNHGKTQKCRYFVLYELYLRTVSKNYLQEIARQREPVDGVIYFPEDRRLGK